MEHGSDSVIADVRFQFKICVGPDLLKYIIPNIRRSDLWRIVTVAIIGGFIGGVYGILHDQVTYAISPEYFTKLKFHQFHYADLGLGNRVFAGTVGFLATWWVGFIAAWLLARRLIPNQPRTTAYRQIRKGVLCIFFFGIAFGSLAYAYGLWLGANADYSAWDWAIQRVGITDKWAFVRVAYIHNAGYLGGLIGLIFALVAIRPKRFASNGPKIENRNGKAQDV